MAFRVHAPHKGAGSRFSAAQFLFKILLFDPFGAHLQPECVLDFRQRRVF